MRFRGALSTLDKRSDTSALEGQFLTQSDREFIATLGAERRVREVSQWRAQLRKMVKEQGLAQLSGADILYNEVGAPYIENDINMHFSISHSRTRVAILLDFERACALDIEELDRDFDCVASRFATKAEIELLRGELSEDILALIWSAKECAYKLSGCNKLDFTRDIFVKSIDSRAKKIEVQTNLHSYELYYSFGAIPHHVIVASSDF